MNMSHPNPATVYTASCNPPRRARPRLDLTVNNLPDDLPMEEEEEDDNESPTDDHSPTSRETTAPGPRKRGRKPSTVSRSAREAQRKLNHSVIEKARRTKINEALAHLRELVPEEYKHRREDNLEEDEDEDYGKQKKRKGQGGKEKEFKLDILVRTVAFVEDLLDQIKTLEARQQPQCQCEKGGEPTQLGKRKRQESDGPTTPKLPPISSWLPTYLPSPPSSTHFQPTTALQMPPTLSLDPTSPRLLRTPDEQVAASLLLRMSGGDKPEEGVRLAHTPASLLGMTLTGRC